MLSRRSLLLGFWLLCLACAGLPTAAHAEEAPALQICTGDDESFPWQLKDRPGVLMHMMRMVEQSVGGKFVITPKPWKRCLLELKSGQVDAAFKASYSAERAADGAAYPMQSGRLDVDKRLLVDSYSLFRLKGAPIEWDGTKLIATGVLGAQSGFSVVAQLKELGAKVDDGNRQAEACLQKLLRGYVVAVALQTQEGNSLLEQNPEFAARIERIQPVLVSKPYFLVFSRNYIAEHESQARLIWTQIAQVRESDAYKKLLSDFK
ncbi:substrate-binding periplasmic protein [Roseateles oligotrophus]|uniref:Transporter substrate-binding domain-containing protein n=1 Tax=Roseateles oligotrophus TaxID=1769250 RepID=A0ABT2YGF5_9BURK|nr:transporter substrate-binding domain-containing protein [Roseateles oligotrophus]MCV2369129.1 transporter substrate-binding domain-containing protein [Roseateles oligotrophus]